MMKIYKISQTVNNNYDTYSAVIVAAETETDAQVMHPLWDGRFDLIPKTEDEDGFYYSSDWTNNPDDVGVEYLGEAKPGTVRSIILASFHAG